MTICKNGTSRIADTDPGFDPTEREIERFWAKVDKAHPSGCWMWTGGINTNGYGCFWMRGTTRNAHRIAWILKHGRLALGIEVLHQCSNLGCVKHLFLGSAADIGRRLSKANHWSARRPERILKGEELPTAKLTDKKVREIRFLLRSGDMSQRSIAKGYGVTHKVIWQVKVRQTWKHVV